MSSMRRGRGLGVIPTPVPLPVLGFIDRDTAARVLMREDGWFMGNTTLYRRAPLLSIEGFPEELGSFTDGYVSRVLALGHGACFSPEVLAAWRRLEGGFAWSHTVDRERLVQLMEAARRKMTEPTSPFPIGYAERWQRRYLFGAQRFGPDRETAAGSDTRERRAPRCGGAGMRLDGVAIPPAAAVGSTSGCAAAAAKSLRHEHGLGALVA